MSLTPQISIDIADPFVKRVRDFCRAQQITVYEGSAYLAKREQPDVRVQLIRLPVSSRDRSKLSEVHLSSLLERLKRWVELQGVHLIQFRGLHLDQDDSQLTFVTEHANPLSSGYATEYMKGTSGLEKLSFLQDVLSGLDYLHRHHFVHGNIRADNVFVKADGKCCLGEFAPTRWPTVDRLSDTEAWLAPELFDSERIRKALIDGWRNYTGEFTYASDVFALGCLAVQIYTGEPPRPQRFPPNARSHRDLWGLVRKPSQTEEMLIPRAIWPVISTMLRYNPKNRMTTSQHLTALKQRNPAQALRLLTDVPPIFAKNQARRLIRSGI